MADVQPHPYPKPVIVQAVAAMLVYAGISLVGLVFYVLSGVPWSWRTVLVVVSIVVSAVCAALMVRTRPLQAHAAASLTVMALAALRVGEPYDWNWASWFVLLSTAALAVPVVRALLVMQQIDRMHGA